MGWSYNILIKDRMLRMHYTRLTLTVSPQVIILVIIGGVTPGIAVIVYSGAASVSYTPIVKWEDTH